MKKVTPRWVHHQLTHKQRVRLCRENLVKFQNGSCRLCDIVTGNEMWIYHKQIHHKSKERKLTWRRSISNYCSSSEQNVSFFSIFFEWNGLVLIHCVDEGKMRDHNYYFENCLKSVVKEILEQRRSSDTKTWNWLRTMLESIFILTLLIV